jgi:hypothetical protein
LSGKKEFGFVGRRKLAIEAKYSPSQPRATAGNPDGRQWTSQDSITTGFESDFILNTLLANSSTVLAEAISEILSDANPDPILSGAEYAQLIERFDKTGNTLMDTLARAHAAVGEGAGPLYGTMVHRAFGMDVKLQNLTGIGIAGVEQSFSWGDITNYGLDGSIRTDVIQRDADGNPVAIWDVKTGNAKLTGSRVREIRQQVDVGPEVPIIELHIGRGVSSKGWGSGHQHRHLITAQIWI